MIRMYPTLFLACTFLGAAAFGQNMSWPKEGPSLNHSVAKLPPVFDEIKLPKFPKDDWSIQRPCTKPNPIPMANGKCTSLLIYVKTPESLYPNIKAESRLSREAWESKKQLSQ